jgi:hypothetical protein
MYEAKAAGRDGVAVHVPPGRAPGGLVSPADTAS